MIAMTSRAVPETAIDLLEAGESPRDGHRAFPLNAIGFSPSALETYAFADRKPVVHDALTVAAAVEFADRTLRRPAHDWRRRFHLRIPVHDLSRWNEGETADALLDAIGFLTGDDWTVEFVPRRAAPALPHSAHFDFAPDTQAVIAYSDGMDSRAVAGLVGRDLGQKLIKVRLGARTPRSGRGRAYPMPFTGVPYRLSGTGSNGESSARNRGFKFSSIAGVAAYLSGANEIIIPESGQGALGPVLIGVAHAYPDYRNHPLFAKKMERYFRVLFGRDFQFRFPRLWHTKGETLRAYADLPEGDDWPRTRSCWRGSRWVSIAGSRRQCGVCASCMLRRMSVHAAGLTESSDTYVAPDLAAESFDAAIDPAFRHATAAFAEYAHAGFLHLDHLADLAGDGASADLRIHAGQIAWALGTPAGETEARLRALLIRHKNEWEHYMASLGARSFLTGRRLDAL